MAATPGRALKPRQSGIPTPGRGSGIPTPSRSRPSSSAAVHHDDSAHEAALMTRALQDAIKSHDPATHRLSEVSTPSFSPQRTTSTSLTGRKSVSGRPASASGSSVYKNRPETPSTRPRSRQSDISQRVASRAGRTFDVGNDVRIESLGFEGILRFIGEIEGKPGRWAGVELRSGFAGKGKNDGSVDGTRYFSCPPKCGVFVATTKLSAPTVGRGGASRPSSVASTRSGRDTPSLSGRMTPSSAFGDSTSSFTIRTTSRLTPAAKGRASLASVATPLARSRVSVDPKTPTYTAATRAADRQSLSDITAGSRASRYIGVTANDLLKSGGHHTDIKRLISPPSSPLLHSVSLASPSATSSEMRRASLANGTLAASPTKSTTSATPRPRAPSRMAMPPPPLPTHAVDPEDDNVSSSVPRALSPSSQTGRPLRSFTPSLQQSPARENRRLSVTEDSHDHMRPSSRIAPSPSPDHQAMVHLTDERDAALAEVANLERQLKTAKRSLNDRDSRLEALTSETRGLQAELERHNIEDGERFQHVEAELESQTKLVAELQHVLATRPATESLNDDTLATKTAEIEALTVHFEKANQDLVTERDELAKQVDELREAGQETIALYEERLSEAETLCRELEDRLASASPQRDFRSSRSGTALKDTSSAAEIDNEMLRDQIHHLREKITTLEDVLDDMRAQSEREEGSIRDRVLRLKEKEDAMKAELSVGRTEVERMAKSEAAARGRIDELEVALRESTFALERSRAEIEGFRTDAPGAPGSRAAPTAVTTTNANSVVSWEAEKVSLIAEIARLQAALDDGAKVQVDDEILAELESGKRRVAELQQALEGQFGEVDRQRKKFNRDVFVSSQPSNTSHAASTPSDRTSLEEISSLKRIIQELQTESVASSQRIKLLESENHSLMIEAEQLRKDMQVLGDNLEQCILREEDALLNGDSGASESDRVVALTRKHQDQLAHLEGEINAARRELSEADMKNARKIHDLNKEITELEALIESKIYREDELEKELERCRDKMARRTRKSSKNSLDPGDLQTRGSSPNSLVSSAESHGQEVCEVCLQPGHDIFNCHLLRDDVPPSSQAQKTVDSGSIFCEDCESRGHTAANCPHALDVF